MNKTQGKPENISQTGLPKVYTFGGESAISVLSAIRSQLPPKRVRTTIFIDPALWAAAKRAAPARGLRSAAAVIEAALARYLIQEGLA